MAIVDIPEYAHLSAAEIEALGLELDTLRKDIEGSRGERDANYIRRTIRLHRVLELSGRALLLVSHRRPLFWFGAGVLGCAKIIENMEIGHNVLHGQWDWMNDPEIHSTNWEWDIVGPAEHWKRTHNFIHHKYTNVLGMDDDVGYGLIRVTRDQRWSPFYLGNIAYNTLLALGFEYGVAAQHLELGKGIARRKNDKNFRADAKLVATKVGKQIGKDYLLFPVIAAALTRSPRRGLSAVGATIAANVIRNVWTNAVIFCGHFPDGAEKFTKQDVENETRGEWYLRQMLGSANFKAGPVLGFMSGNLSYQIEHHCFPDLPSNRLAEISKHVQTLCATYDLPYTTGSFPVQYLKTWRTIAKLSLPNKYLMGSTDHSPETNSAQRFAELENNSHYDPATGKRRGLVDALRQTSKKRSGIPKLVAR